MATAETGRLHPLERRVQRFVAEEGLWPPDGRLLLAVSGGQDSTALLLILARLAPRRNVRLAVAHFDHGLRGRDAAARERAAVEALCASLALPLTGGGDDVRSRARAEGRSLEEAARLCRYEFLAGVARQQGITHVATGHTLSDQAETLLLHLVRGAGLAGLAGMAPRGGWPLPGGDGLVLLRPLLALRREETLACCRRLGVEPLQDESNLALDFRRNRLRLEVLPLLRDLNPRIEDALGRLATAARETEDYLEGAARAALRSGDGAVALARSVLAAWPAALQVRACALAYEALLGERRELASSHLRALRRLLLRGKTGDRVDLPRGVVATLTLEELRLDLAFDECADALPAGVAHLAVPGSAEFGPLRVQAMSGPARGMDAMSASVDAAAAGGRLQVRRRRPGDRFQPLGMAAAKKLQDFFVDAHVERSRRDSIPLFVNERGIVWVGGLRIADWARPRPDRPAVTLSYQPAAR